MRALQLPVLLWISIVACQSGENLAHNQPQDYAIIPKPTSVVIQDGRFDLDPTDRVSAPPALAGEAQYLSLALSEAIGEEIPKGKSNSGNIRLSLVDAISDPEAYLLEITPDFITISASSPRGAFYGIQSLLQLIDTSNGSESAQVSFPAGNISDAPRFDYRGMHLDVCRHFFPVEFVKQYIDLLAMHKLNTFHWHLTEDQGWRIEIKQYPKLTEVGAWRNGTIVGHYPGSENDNKVHGGFYTQDEVRDIIEYAAERHITIIPEIELPGHSSAAIASYPLLSCFPDEPSVVPNNMISEASLQAQKNGQPKIVQESWGVFNDVYCAGQEETFEFVENVLDEVMALFPSEYIHIGGDECPKGNWEKCPKCQQRKKDEGLADEHELQSYFIQRVEKYVNSKGKKIIGWDEILEGGLAPNATVMSWRGNAGGIAAAQADHTVIMSPNSHCYFDHYQAEDKENEPLAIGGYLPLEKVYSFNPIPEALDSSKHRFILGGQANLWTEYIASEEQAEYMLLPRLSALSEVLWSAPDQSDWKDFNERLVELAHRFEDRQLNYAKHAFE